MYQRCTSKVSLFNMFPTTRIKSLLGWWKLIKPLLYIPACVSMRFGDLGEDSCVSTSHMSFKSCEYELRKRQKFTFLHSKTPKGLWSRAHTWKETFTRTPAVCFCGETKFRRSLPVFCFPLRRPSDLFNKLEEYWLTINGYIGLEVFSFYPLLLLHFLTAETVDHTEWMLRFRPTRFFLNVILRATEELWRTWRVSSKQGGWLIAIVSIYRWIKIFSPQSR